MSAALGVASILRQVRATLDEAGLRGSLLVRNLDTGEELGLAPDLEYPVASLAKVPLALAVLERIRRGELAAATPIRVPPPPTAISGTTGLTRFRHPATVAVEDLLYLSLAVSDNVASDLLFGLVPPAEVMAESRRLGFAGISIRHLIGVLADTPAERFAPDETHLAHSLAITAGTDGHGHPVSQLDVSRANSGSARAFVDLLHGLWRPTTIDVEVAGRLRELLGDNLLRQRLAPDFSADASRWSSKTGTLLNLRHEVGVVEHADGGTYAVAALTESRVAAAVQPAAEAAMASAARLLHDQLRLSAW